MDDMSSQGSYMIRANHIDDSSSQSSFLVKVDQKYNDEINSQDSFIQRKPSDKVLDD